MPALTKDQVTAINNAINAVQRYLAMLQKALTDMAMSNNPASNNPENAVTIDYYYEQGQLLENNLKGLLALSDLASVKASVTAIKATTSNLNAQAATIDNVVKAVGTAATVVGDITAVIAAVVEIAAVL